MAFLVYLLLLSISALIGQSSALYCVCKDGVGDQVLQKNIDYACGAGADCTPILQNGACYNPNTVKDHCNWAVNSYFQKSGQTQGSCDFAGTATTSANPPSTSSSCVYPSSNTGTPTTGTPGTSPSTISPPTGTGTGTGIGTGTGTGTGNGSPVFGISPSASTSPFNDGSNGGKILVEGTKLLIPLVFTLWLSFLRF
ncbi:PLASMODESMATA CALLOSE-BINDING PROTEIN 3-like [Prosopis cineraria]|uniref:PLASMODESMATA CALLOSE-BINDING PROTEIN 3-like n=1 Tax=Prosopis cineraria TaxID=364024 RepID=UPI00240F95A0|nr:PLASMODESMATA CALLOSE-BINDING PROTEIN 3-like [Prosopis cineraria]XP_054825490.1 PLASMODESMATA CALLOSE-BINDING PROTEIN 3-like [Prosopis cineraria]XP_054825491.1 PLASMODESMATA CALLOSE-BINDING PROTEIN 3-like [Prosopis cineraria]